MLVTLIALHILLIFLSLIYLHYVRVWVLISWFIRCFCVFVIFCLCLIIYLVIY